MLVFWRQHLVFLATPKTASTAIESALGALAEVAVQQPAALKHTDVATFRRHLGPYLAQASGHEFSTLALMREPKGWLSSWYRTRQRDEESDATSTRDVTFDEFVRAWCRQDPPAFARVGAQSHFLAPALERRADHVFRYESLGDFVRFLEDRLDFEIHLPRMNVSPGAETLLSGESMDLLRDKGRAEFLLYESLANPPK